MPSDKPDLCLGMNPINGKMRYRLDGMVLDGPDAWLHLRRIGMFPSIQRGAIHRDDFGRRSQAKTGLCQAINYAGEA